VKPTADPGPPDAAAAAAMAKRPRGAATETVLRHFIAWIFGLGRNAWLFPLDLTFRFIGVRYGWLKALFETVPPPVLRLTGRLRAERAAWRAIKRVPAYRAHLRAAGIDHDRLLPAGILEAIPETDKRTYIDLYALAERCLDGRIRFKGVVAIDALAAQPLPDAVEFYTDKKVVISRW